MLDILGPSRRFCDGITRRSFLRVGSLALAGANLPSLLHAENALPTDSATPAIPAAGVGKSVIMVYLTGGLSHQDTFDLKPDSPTEVRGEFKPIETRVPGVRIGELLPRMAQAADRYTILRSIVGLRDEHSSFQNVTGFRMDESQREGKPSVGSVVSRVQGPRNPLIPPFVDLFPTMQHRPYNSPGPGVLGRSHAGVKVGSEDLSILRVTTEGLRDLERRRSLQARLESLAESPPAHSSVAIEGMDAMVRRAYGVLASTALLDALDVEREPAEVRERYGRGSSKHLGDGAPMWNDQLLAARRLVEAGARCVTVAYGFWDTHGNNFGHLKQHLPLFDQGISALIEDIYARGLDREVTIVVWGEFGRMPKINKDAGRDHWAPVASAILAGGGMRVGQVIGSTDSIAAYAVDRPIHYHDVLATIYHNLGISPQMFVADLSGRPTPILTSTAEPIRELIG